MKRIILLLIILSAACKESYVPPAISSPHAFLVVEGFINSGPDSTLISLSRTYKLNDPLATSAPEGGAQVSVQGNDNTNYPLAEIGDGQYGAANLALNPAQQYRLMILTGDGKQIQSDYVPVKISPPIDSVNWASLDKGLQIFVNTHDPQNKSLYYRWTYGETWEFHSAFAHALHFQPDTVYYQFPIIDYDCWKSDSSSTVILGSSAKLARDEIFEAPLVLIPRRSPKMGIGYSLFVKQQVLTKEAYDFWLNLRTNTEQIGTIFSPQPSAPAGNLHCVTDPAEQVIGFISAGDVRAQRFFIDPEKIPDWDLPDYSNGCKLHDTPNEPDSLDRWFAVPGFLPVDFINMGSRVVYSELGCVDCRVQGTNVKPSFWPF